MRLKLILASVCIALAACASTGGKNATDANVIAGLNATYQVAQTLFAADKLTVAEAQAVEDSLNAIYGFVKASRSAAAAGDTTAQANYLRSAADALDALTAKLLAKKG